MGWQTESSTHHEGWTAPVLPDGRMASGSTRGAVLVGNDAIPQDQVVAFRATCECGWTGALWTRAAEPGAADEPSRQIYTATGFNDDVPEHVEQLMWREWRDHVDPIERIADVEDAATRYAEAGTRLTETVLAARRVGATWAEVGKAVGITRQTAHVRWSGTEQ